LCPWSLHTVEHSREKLHDTFVRPFEAQQLMRSIGTSINMPSISSHLHKNRFRWTIHMILGLIVLCSGMLRNWGGRKYIPVSSEAMPLRSCKKLYANVYALSETENGALICCGGSNIEGWWDVISYEGFLCSQKIKPLPLVKSITRLPDLLLLTFLPFLLRLIIHLYGWMTKADDTHPDIVRSTANRLFLYILIMMIRVFILFIFFNQIQNDVHDIWNTSIPSEMVEGSDEQTMETCWYDNFLIRHRVDNSCYGRQFDFSDHIILFLRSLYLVYWLKSQVCLHRKEKWRFQVFIHTHCYHGVYFSSTRTSIISHFYQRT